MTAATAIIDDRPDRTVPWRRLAVAALPAAIYLGIRGLGVLLWWSMAALHHKQLNLHAWDGDWYLAIARYGYAQVPTSMLDAFGHHTPSTAMVFFPGYPQLVRVVAVVCAHNYLLAGVLVSALAGVAASLGVARLARHYTTSRRAELIAVVLFAAAPMSVIYGMTYPEALLMATGAWALVGVVEHRWWLAGLAAAAAGYVSPMAAPAAAVVVIAAVVDLYRSRSSWPAVVAMNVAGAGLIGYLVWVSATSPVPGGYVAIQKAGWGTRIDGGWSMLRWILRTFAADGNAYTVFTALACVAAVAALVVAWRRLPWTLWTYSLLTVAMVLGSAGIPFDRLRLLLAAWPLLIPLAESLTRRNRRTALTTLAIVALAGLWISAYSLTVWNYAV